MLWASLWYRSGIRFKSSCPVALGNYMSKYFSVIHHFKCQLLHTVTFRRKAPAAEMNNKCFCSYIIISYCIHSCTSQCISVLITQHKVSAIINIKTMILHHFHYAKFQVLTAVLLKIKVLGDVTLYYWVSSFRYFEEL